MSFLLGALGSLGKSFLGGGGVGGLLSRVASKVPMIGRAGTYIKDMLRSSPIARSAADYVVNKAIDVGGNLVNRFAQSDFIRRKLPIAVPYLQNGASALQDRLRQGYSDFVDGGSKQNTTAFGDGGGGRGESITRTKMM